MSNIKLYIDILWIGFIVASVYMFILGLFIGASTQSLMINVVCLGTSIPLAMKYNWFIVGWIEKWRNRK